MLNLLKIPGVIVCAVGISSTALSLGFILATLEPQLRQFNLSNLIVGHIIICSPSFYTISSPLWGFLADIKLNLKLLSFAGAIFMLTGILIVGPASFLPFEPTVPTEIIGLAFYGIGIGGIFIPSFPYALEAGTIFFVHF
jgi:hypothetical protein